MVLWRGSSIYAKRSIALIQSIKSKAGPSQSIDCVQYVIQYAGFGGDNTRSFVTRVVKLTEAPSVEEIEQEVMKNRTKYKRNQSRRWGVIISEIAWRTIMIS